MSLSGQLRAAGCALLLASTNGLAAAPSATASATSVAAPLLATEAVGARIDALAAGADALPRDRRASLVRRLSILGPDASDALRARALADSPAMAALRLRDASAARAFDAAVLEALGRLRDPRALGLFTDRFRRTDLDPRVAQAVADGLGRLCAAGGFPVLEEAARSAGTRAPLAWTALGLCRTESAAGVLAARLDATAEVDDVRTLADALGTLGSTWAWQAMGPSRQTEGARVRRIATVALHRALPRVDASARPALLESLRMVGE